MLSAITAEYCPPSAWNHVRDRAEYALDAAQWANPMSDSPILMTDTANIPPRDKAEILAQALPYIRKFHGKTMVIKYGGNAMTDPALQQDFAEDVVLLKLVGINPVVVHGGGPQIENALKRLGKKGEFIQGMRVTDAETMEVVEWVLGGEVQQDIVGLINQAGGKAVGLTGRDGGMIRAQKLKMLDSKNPDVEHDVGQVGDIISIDPSVVKALQDDAFIPVISPIGYGEDNESYNINADVVAAKLAVVLRAEKLMMLTNISGVLDKDGKLLTDLTARRIDELFADGTISGGMLPKIAGALDAAKSGVNSVHIIDGRVPHVLLLEILTDQAFGTMIRSH
jgi:acetylglutamate kinase